MKIRTILTLGTLTLALGFTACGQDNDETAQLKEQVAQLEQQVEDLKKYQGSGQAETDASSQDPAASPTEDPQTEQSQQPQQDLAAPDAASLSAAISDLEQEIQNTTPTGSAQEQMEQFLALKSSLDLIDRQLDQQEDDLEAQYRAGSIDHASYWQQEQDVEALEDRLDTCEDRLESLFGIDD